MVQDSLTHVYDLLIGMTTLKKINMKSFIVFLIYVSTWMLGFLTMSLIGLLWADSYRQIISNPNWFMMYSLFIGWWLSILPAREYYTHHQQYFETYL